MLAHFNDVQWQSLKSFVHGGIHPLSSHVPASDASYDLRQSRVKLKGHMRRCNEMPEHTLTALRGSISKWEGILAGTIQDEGPRNCPLCKLFWYVGEDCKGCPVAASTGFSNCGGTPYEDFGEVMESGVSDSERQRLGKEIAQRELDFLKSLLPNSARVQPGGDPEK